MGEVTGINWTDSTFSPWWGCTRIAPACDHCYAAALDKRTGGNHWGNVPRRRTSVQSWNNPRRWQKKAAEFFAEHGRRRRVFSASMADIFDNQVPEEWRMDFWDLVRDCPDINFQILTKRPQNIDKMLPIYPIWNEIKGHVWLGTTIEDQEHADKNLPHLLKQDAAVLFVSCEPLLGSLDISWSLSRSRLEIAAGFQQRGHFSPGLETVRRLDWVISGGESGPQARPSHPEWFRSLRDQCQSAGVAYLHKQNGEFVSVSEVEGKGMHYHFSDGTTVRRIGVRNSGRTIDGVTHDAFPVTP